MTITEKLQRLLRTKQRIREEIINKGIAVDSSEPFSNYAGKISLIETGGNSTVEKQILFNEKFGYSNNVTLDNLKKCDWAQADFSNMFRECKELVSVKGIDFKNSSVCTDFSYMFYKCSKLEEVDPFDMSSATNLTSMFEGCEVLQTFPAIDTANATNFTNILKDTYHLTDISNLNTSKGTDFSKFLLYSGIAEIPSLDFSSATSLNYAFSNSSVQRIGDLNTPICQNFTKMFDNCTFLEKVDSIDVKGAAASYSDFGSAPNLRYMVVKNLGSRSVHTYFYFNNLPSWGINSETIPDARQSLIDSLITYSCDRVGSGFKHTFKVRLSETTAAILTDSEIAQITEKGFTIEVV